MEWFDPFCWRESSQDKKRRLCVAKNTEYYVTTAFLNRHQASPNVSMAKTRIVSRYVILTRLSR